MPSWLQWPLQQKIATRKLPHKIGGHQHWASILAATFIHLASRGGFMWSFFQGSPIGSARLMHGCAEKQTNRVPELDTPFVAFRRLHTSSHSNPASPVQARAGAKPCDIPGSSPAARSLHLFAFAPRGPIHVGLAAPDTKNPRSSQLHGSNKKNERFGRGRSLNEHVTLSMEGSRRTAIPPLACRQLRVNPWSSQLTG